jgi:hypothetical protein
MSTYNPKNVIATVGGKVITGFAQDTFVTAERDEDAISTAVDITGKVTYIENNNEQGTIKLTLQQNSPSNKILTDYANQKKAFAINITDTSFSKEVGCGGSEARVIKIPELSRGNDLANREWIIKVSKLEFKHQSTVAE